MPRPPKKERRGRMTPYAFFVQAERRKINSDESVIFSEFSKKCSNQWKTISEIEKKLFYNMAVEDKNRYEIEMKNCVPKKRKKKNKDPNKPKRSLSAFFWFCHDERGKVRAINPDIGIGDMSKELSKRWANTTLDIREKYKAMSEKDSVRYMKEMSAYKLEPKEEKGMGSPKIGTECSVVEPMEERKYERTPPPEVRKRSSQGRILQKYWKNHRNGIDSKDRCDTENTKLVSDSTTSLLAMRGSISISINKTNDKIPSKPHSKEEVALKSCIIIKKEDLIAPDTKERQKKDKVPRRLNSNNEDLLKGSIKINAEDPSETQETQESELNFHTVALNTVFIIKDEKEDELFYNEGESDEEMCNDDSNQFHSYDPTQDFTENVLDSSTRLHSIRVRPMEELEAKSSKEIQNHHPFLKNIQISVIKESPGNPRFTSTSEKQIDNLHVLASKLPNVSLPNNGPGLQDCSHRAELFQQSVKLPNGSLPIGAALEDRSEKPIQLFRQCKLECIRQHTSHCYQCNPDCISQHQVLCRQCHPNVKRQHCSLKILQDFVTQHQNLQNISQNRMYQSRQESCTPSIGQHPTNLQYNPNSMGQSHRPYLQCYPGVQYQSQFSQHYLDRQGQNSHLQHTSNMQHHSQFGYNLT